MNLTNCLLFFLIGATLAFNVAIFKFQKSLDASIATFLDNTSKSSKSFLEVVERTRTFEATGFEADVTDDGRIKIVFLRKVASKEEDDSKKDMAEFREIVVPAWMFTQITSEAALKLGFEALENKATKDDTSSTK